LPADAPAPEGRHPLRWVGRGVAIAVAVAFVGLLAFGLATKSADTRIDDALAGGKPAPAPGFSLAVLQRGDVSGPRLARALGDGRLSLTELRGFPVVLNFWASWCVPCREEMPALDALAAKFNSDAFQVLPVNLDIGESGLEKGKEFLKQGNWPNLPLYADPSFKAFERLKTEAVAIGLPATLLLDEDGCELAVLQGPAAWHSPDGERVIEALIGLRKNEG
jgi:thiol-disulfide isomerase/thioredoxin